MGMIIQNGKVYSGGVEIKGAKIDTLWSGTASSAGDLNLTGNYDDYDLLIFFGYNTSATTYTSVVFYKNALNVAYTNNSGLLVVDNSIATTDRRVFLKIVSRNKVTITSAESGSQLKSIVGIKLNDSAMINYHKYSTDEQVVGEWIDGKTLYEKTVPFSTPSSNAYTRVTIASGVEIGFCDTSATFVIGSGQTAFLGSYISNPNADQFVGLENIDSSNNLSLDYRVGTAYQNKQGYATFRYTKISS